MPVETKEAASPRSAAAARSATVNQMYADKGKTVTAEKEVIDPKTGGLMAGGKPIVEGPPLPKMEPVKVTGTTDQKAASAAVKPTNAGSVRNAGAIRQQTTTAVDNDSEEATKATLNTDISNLNRSIAALQATNATQTADITALKQQVATSAAALNGVQTQIGMVQTAQSTATGATSSNTGVATTSSGGGILSFFGTNTGKLVVVGGIAAGIFFYVRSRGGWQNLGGE